MDVVFDSTYLIDLFNPKVQGDQRAALDHLVEDLGKSKSRIWIPGPCVTELLVHADKAGNDYLRLITSSSRLTVLPFDTRAATECALLLKWAWGKKLHRGITHTKFKFDWMIIASAASRNVEAIYSDDKDIARGGAMRNIRVIAQAALPIPSTSRQHTINYEFSAGAASVESPGEGAY